MTKEVTSDEIAKAVLAFDTALEMLSPEDRESFGIVGRSIVAVASSGADKRDLDRLERENKKGIAAGAKIFKLAEDILNSGEG